MPPQKIIFSGVGKDNHEIEFALKNDILQFNIESEEELNDISAIASRLKLTANICLRVNPDIAPKTHKKISTGEKETKFGIDFQNVKSIYKKLHQLDYINPVGLGVHIGSQIFDFKTNIPMVGASGAIYGILMAFAMLFPNLELILLFPPLPIRAKYLVFIYGAIELYSELNRSEGDNVAHLAHLSGMLIAFVLIRIWTNNKTIKPVSYTHLTLPTSDLV